MNDNKKDNGNVPLRIIHLKDPTKYLGMGRDHFNKYVGELCK